VSKAKDNKQNDSKGGERVIKRPKKRVGLTLQREGGERKRNNNRGEKEVKSAKERGSQPVEV